MQAFINQAEGRWRVDTSEAGPGHAPSAIAAAPHLSLRQADRDEFEEAVQAAVRAKRAQEQAAAVELARKRGERRQAVGDAIAALIACALITLCLMAGELPPLVK